MIVTPSTLQIEKSRVTKLHFCHITISCHQILFHFRNDIERLSVWHVRLFDTSQIMTRPEIPDQNQHNRRTVLSLDSPLTPEMATDPWMRQFGENRETSADSELDKENLNKLVN